MALRSSCSCAFVVLVAWLALAGSLAQAKKTGKGSERKEGPDAHYIKEDLPLIRCPTCVAMAEIAFNVQEAMRNDTNFGPNEGVLLHHLEALCDVRTYGRWISYFDLQEQGEYLVPVNMKQGLGVCGSECRTMAKACSDILDEVDLLDFSAFLWKRMELQPLVKTLCEEMTSACVIKAVPMKPGRIPGPEWKPAPTEQPAPTQQPAPTEAETKPEL